MPKGLTPNLAPGRVAVTARRTLWINSSMLARLHAGRSSVPPPAR